MTKRQPMPESGSMSGMRARRLMMWSGGAATLLFLVAQFLPLRSLIVNYGNSASDTNAHILFTTATTTGIAAPVTVAAIDPSRLVVVVLAVGLLATGLILAVRRSSLVGAGTVLLSAGAGMLLGVSGLVLSAPFPTDFGWFAYSPISPAAESAELVASGVAVSEEIGVGFYLAGLASLSAVVCLVAAAAHAVQGGRSLPPRPPSQDTPAPPS